MIYHEDGDLNAILIENKRLVPLISMCLNIVISLSFLHYLLHFGQFEIIKLWRDKNSMIKKMESIFHSLQEAIITINISGVSFINEHGRNILKDIENQKDFVVGSTKFLPGGASTLENKGSQLFPQG
jgi:sensor histidine kinase regulating citrate/malate metabolism